MRLSFDSLAGLVRQQLKQNPMGGHLYVFFNKRHDCIKILVWDRHGWSMLYKRLEKGTFRPPDAKELEEQNMEIENARLAMILEGIDLREGRIRKRWAPTKENRDEKIA
jgi:transposase